MNKRLLQILLMITLSLPQFAFAQDKDDLDKYIRHLKDDHAGERKETGFLTAGNDFLYAQDYFEAKNYSSAADYFMDVLKKQSDNAFANYQLAISLLKQNDKYKKEQAQEYLKNAFRLNASLRDRYKRDMPEDTGVTEIKKVPAEGSKSANNNAHTLNADNVDGLDAYVNRLKKSRAIGGAETAMNTTGQRALSGIEYYEANGYIGAETDFKIALAQDPNNGYVNYMLAVSMAAQGKSAEAAPYLQRAVAIDPSLKDRYTKDVNAATVKWQAVVEKEKIKTTPATKVNYGGPLLYGDYTCSQTVWNGPNVSPAYHFEYKGYFSLKADGTYRWLNNGGSGTYKYDAATGNITWSSGYFKTVQPKATLFQQHKETVQINIEFTDSYRWECGSKKQ